MSQVSEPLADGRIVKKVVDEKVIDGENTAERNTVAMPTAARPAEKPIVEKTSSADSRFSITAKDVNLWYGDFQALFDVTLDFRQGIITGLIGPSGCGKTTLLRSLNRINERYGNVTTQGEIKILDKNIYDPDVSLSELRKSVGMVFQRPNPLPISIYENIIFGARVHSDRGELSRAVRDEMVESALREVQLWDEMKDKLKKKATTLTLEQQQKLCIARLLPLKPRVILMDEPCSALDAEGIERVEELIGELRGKFTVIVVTHNMAQARRATDECIYMLLGKIIEHAPTNELFLNPQHEETEMYIQGRYG
jgi:phosphate transport system ATP-binding protein